MKDYEKEINFFYKKIVKNYLTSLGLLEKLMVKYKTIHLWMYESGMTKKDTLKVSEAPFEVWEAREGIHRMIMEMEREVKILGIPNHSKIVTDVIMDEMRKIDEQYPIADE